MIYRLFALVVALCVLAGCPSSGGDSNQSAEPTWQVERADDNPTVSPVAAVVADMDGDGKLDIVSAWRGSTDPNVNKPGLIAIHLQNGSGLWQTLVVEQGSRYQLVNAITVADVNVDTHPDIVVAAMDRIIYLRAPADLRADPGVGGSNAWTSFDLAASIGDKFKAWYDVAVGQIDGQAGPDIAATLADDGRLVWFKAPTNPDTAADWVLEVIDATTRKQCDSLILADLNGDQKLDVISTAPGEAQDIISWYEHPANLDTNPWVKHAMSNFAGATRIALGDLDGDGKPDLVAISPKDKRVAWLIQPATASSRWGGFVMADFSQSLDKRQPVAVAIADIDADGHKDIVIAATGPGIVSWFKPGSNDQLFWNEYQIVRSADIDVGLIGLGDINADNFVDVAVPEDNISRDTNDGAYWYRNPHFNTQPSTQPTTQTSTEPAT